jgi:hypothetical protein
VALSFVIYVPRSPVVEDERKPPNKSFVKVANRFEVCHYATFSIKPQTRRKNGFLNKKLLTNGDPSGREGGKKQFEVFMRIRFTVNENG